MIKAFEHYHKQWCKIDSSIALELSDSMLAIFELSLFGINLTRLCIVENIKQCFAKC